MRRLLLGLGVALGALMATIPPMPLLGGVAERAPARRVHGKLNNRSKYMPHIGRQDIARWSRQIRNNQLTGRGIDR